MLEGRKREELVGEFGNIAHHKQGLTDWRGGLEEDLARESLKTRMR